MAIDFTVNDAHGHGEAHLLKFDIDEIRNQARPLVQIDQSDDA